MKLPRRTFLHLAAAAAALPAVSRVAKAQTYPTRPVRLIVGFAPGGGDDVLARLLGLFLSERLGQQFVIENRPGAATNLATEVVVRATPDGYTLLLVGATSSINATLYDNLNFNFIRDITPVGGVTRVPNVVQVNLKFSPKTIPELITYARTNKINYATGGIGTSGHVSAELFKMMTGVNMLHIPYRGAGPAITDLLGGQVDLMFATMPSSVEYIRAGKVRALAVTSAARSDALPDVPTVGEFVPDFEASAPYGIGAPKNTPTEIIQKLNKEILGVLEDPKFRLRLADLGGLLMPMTPAEFGKLIGDETAKWAKVVKFANMKPE